jgi:predicted DCC family thiol-disulfide oxidoreductase YuxK
MKLKYEIAVVGVGILLIAVPLIFWRYAPKFIKAFFTEAAAPVNLAVFRIVFFVIILFSFSVDNVAWFGSLQAELRFPPTGLNSILAHIPINESVAWFAAVALVVACLACILGLFTRTSIIVCLVLSLYVLGLPQLFGKMNHYHHLIWFMAILAVSPCADVLSVDAIFKSWKRADRGRTEPPEPSQAYSLPLRFVWLLMGVIYFSAGFWKVWTAGYHWAWSDNPRNIMYNKWMELSGWVPFFRVDHYPIVYKLSAAGTLVFELSFLVLIFFPAVRYLAPLGGLAFHNMTNLFMRISFWYLQGCYVAFVNWHSVFRSIGRKLFSDEMHVIYDGNCQLCRRTIASFRVFDLFERVTYVNGLDSEALAAHGLSWLDPEALIRDMHVVVGQNIWTGFAAYRKWLTRLPLFWIALPLTYLPPIALPGQRIYRRIADSRACRLADKSVESGVTRKRMVFATVLVGSLLVYLAILSAVAKLQSWPMAAYPSFEDLDKPEVMVLTMAAQSPDGLVTEIRPIKHESLKQLPAERLMGLQNSLLNVVDESERHRRLVAFWRLWANENPSLNRTATVKFFRDKLSSLPEDQNHDPITRELVYEWRCEAPRVAAR